MDIRRQRRALEGDFIKVDIPGPGPGVGNGYDWVRIESIEERQYNIITCKDSQVEAIIVDSNVLPNNDAGNVKDQLRDVAVALAGIVGLSRLQWEGLVEGFLS